MMHFLSALTACAVFINSASAHYIWQTINQGAVKQYIRTNTNYNSPVIDVTSTDMRCNVGSAPVSTYTVAAGTTIKLGLDIAVYHQGPLQFYLGFVPSGQTAATWDGSGTQWIKFKELGPVFSNGVASWPYMSQYYDVTIPRSIPSGDYLLRVHQIAIHNPYPAGIPQFYIGCAQLTVTGGAGSCTGSKVAIPSDNFMTATDPGITVNIYNQFTSYTYPGKVGLSCTS